MNHAPLKGMTQGRYSFPAMYYQ